MLLASTACLRATIFKIKIPSDQPRSDAFRKELGEMAAKMKVPDFVPSDAEAQAIQADVEKNAKGGDKEEEAKEAATKAFEQQVTALISVQLDAVIKQIQAKQEEQQQLLHALSTAQSTK